jgi:hypothetical protein
MRPTDASGRPRTVRGRSDRVRVVVGPPRALASGQRGRRFKSGHPDIKTAGHTVSDDLRFAFRLCRCPILGAKRERASAHGGTNTPVSVRPA